MSPSARQVYNVVLHSTHPKNYYAVKLAAAAAA